MLLIHSSFSSSVEADILYTVCFPSTTLPSLSVLQALITSLPAQNSSKQCDLLRSVTSRICKSCYTLHSQFKKIFLNAPEYSPGE